MKTYRDLCNEIQMLPYSKDILEIQKESLELELMESYLDNQLYLRENFNNSDILQNDVILENVSHDIKLLGKKIWKKIFDFLMKILRLIRNGLSTLINYLDRNFNPDEYERMIANAKKAGSGLIGVGKEIANKAKDVIKENLKESYDFSIYTESSLYENELKKFEKAFKQIKSRINNLSFISEPIFRSYVKRGWIKIFYGDKSKINIIDFFKDDLNQSNIKDKYQEFVRMLPNKKNERKIEFEVNNDMLTKYFYMDLETFENFEKYLADNSKIFDNNIEDFYNLLTSEGYDNSPKMMVTVLFVTNVVNYFCKKYGIKSIGDIIHYKLFKFTKSGKVIFNNPMMIYCEKLNSLTNRVYEIYKNELRRISKKIKDITLLKNNKNINKKTNNFFKSKIQKFWIKFDIKKNDAKAFMDIIDIYHMIINRIYSMTECAARLDVLILQMLKEIK